MSRDYACWVAALLKRCLQVHTELHIFLRLDAFAPLQMSPPLHYDATQRLKINGLSVSSLTITGVLAEKIANIAREKGINPSGLIEEDLPKQIFLKLDGYGQRDVWTKAGDRRLALVVYRAVRMKLSSMGLELYKACVEVRNGSGGKIGEHDMLCEIVSVADPALRGLISVELKLRLLWSLAGRDKVRLLLREECCDACSWWQGERDKYSGRLIVLAHFSERGNEKFDLYGDLRMNREGAWRGFFGWPHSRPDWVLPVAIPKAAPKAKANAAPKATAKAAPKAAPKAAVGGQRRGTAILDGLPWKNGLASLKAFSLEVKGKSGETNASYWANKAKRDYLWTESDIFQKAVKWEVRPGQKRQRIGGKPEWVAKRRVLEQMYMDFCGAGSL